MCLIEHKLWFFIKSSENLPLRPNPNHGRVKMWHWKTHGVLPESFGDLNGFPFLHNIKTKVNKLFLQTPRKAIR